MRTTALVSLFALIAVNPITQAFAQQPKAPEPRTAAAVIADDDAWGHAEQTGDAAFVDALLLPQYRSIDAAGKTHDKATIVASAKASPQRDAMFASWKAAHPSLTSVEIEGDTAVLTFTLNKPGTPAAIMSCDIFVYRDGHWRALYSQHTTAEA